MNFHFRTVFRWCELVARTFTLEEGTSYKLAPADKINYGGGFLRMYTSYILLII